MSKEEFHVTEGNIFADLDLADSEELLVRSELLSEVCRLIKRSGHSQKKIASILGISQPKVSMLVSGKLSAFSTDSLMHYLSLLGCNIEIRLRPRSPSRSMSRGKMTVRKNATVHRLGSKRAKKLV